jgi:hypothetical protein
MTREPNKSSLTTSNYNRSLLLDSMTKSKKKEVEISDGIQVSGTADENFTYSFADLDTSELTMTMSGPETSYTIDGMMGSDEVELREKYPALQQAHEHYLSVLEICKTKEKEEDED